MTRRRVGVVLLCVVVLGAAPFVLNRAAPPFLIEWGIGYDRIEHLRVESAGLSSREEAEIEDALSDVPACTGRFGRIVSLTWYDGERLMEYRCERSLLGWPSTSGTVSIDV